ncbi:MAG TPA: formate dehydrogenase subunit gamma [Pseudolabrys sp.]|nr:formate dehydrogenase subunit gamma [Pseudolabrys sp.]
MARLLANIRLIVGALALGLVIAMTAPAFAQRSIVDPNADAVTEQQLLKQLKGGVISGQVSIPDQRAANLIHPAGREWRKFRTIWLKWIGGIVILGMLALLVIFYLWRGTIRIEGGRSGRKLVRFTAFERFVHWLTASTFVILGITGLNITFGRALILPWLGLESFSAWSEWAKYAHNFLSFAFTIGVVLMFLMWIGQNFPTKADITWFKMGGGMGKGSAHAPAWKFNAGQKLLYWFIVLGGVAMMISGYMLIFPFAGGLNVGDMQLAQIFHGVVGMLFIALILAHIYLGTLGMEGAFESMADGTVDYNWAKEHHPLWLEEEMAQTRSGKGDDRLVTSTPAE